ncbi:protein lifeguard 2-like isoform X1 [Varroa destructor]|uniref:Uncharacterized protein n=1 Tax=Varroa destructor TaxID=109461 RepID=A0A7M7JEJ8_VARDE|nr:protein lifeguard 2-like isoform X1 [Varroa destructor]
MTENVTRGEGSAMYKPSSVHAATNPKRNPGSKNGVTSTVSSDKTTTPRRDYTDQPVRLPSSAPTRAALMGKAKRIHGGFSPAAKRRAQLKHGKRIAARRSPPAYSVFGLSKEKERCGFMRKVYIILSLQMVVTAGIAASFVLIQPVKRWTLDHYWIVLVALAIYLPLYFILACCTSVRRSSPLNVILLTLITLAMSILVGIISSTYPTFSIILVFGISAISCLGVTLFAFKTKFDFTSCFGVIFVLFVVMVLFGLVLVFVRITAVHQVYAGLGASLYMLYLSFDTHMVMGRKKYQLSGEDYVFGALTLYADIVNIFFFVLQFMGQR